MAVPTIKYYDEEGHDHICKISGKPDTCPVCRHKIDPKFCYAFSAGGAFDGRLEIVFRCPSQGCKHLFIGYYYAPRPFSPTGDYFILDRSRLPLIIDLKEFSDIIKKVSKKFPIIYNQAMLAENNGLDQICGSGYRRALEFLVKDYLISLHPDEEEEIKKLWLGKAIQKVNNENIKACAERAAWLGNDETHYVRIWEDKDIENLKDLIDLAKMWIESEEKTKKYKKEMPGSE